MNLTSTPTGALVDKFGTLKAAVADLSGELDAIKEVLIGREGESKLEGELFRLALSNTLSQRVDWKAVALAMAKKAAVTDKAFDKVIADNTNISSAWVARAAARVTK